MIPIILIRPRELRCPQCRHVLKRGNPRFGPSMVVCRNCKKDLQTGLKPWAEFSLFERAALALGELLGASRWGPFPYACLLNCMFTSLCAMMVCGTLYGINSETGGVDRALAFLAVFFCLVGPLFLILALLSIRLMRMILESDAYSKTGIPPEWDAGIL